MGFSSLWVFSMRGCGPTPSKSNFVCGPALRVVWCFVMLCDVMYVWLDQALVAVISCCGCCKWLCVFGGSVHNEAKPIFYFGYLKERAIQCACGREMLIHTCTHTCKAHMHY